MEQKCNTRHQNKRDTVSAVGGGQGIAPRPISEILHEQTQLPGSETLNGKIIQVLQIHVQKAEK